MGTMKTRCLAKLKKNDIIEVGDKTRIKEAGNETTDHFKGTMAFFSNILSNRTLANKTPPNFSDADMIEVEAGQNSRALVVYDSGTPNTNMDDPATSTNPRTPRKHVPDRLGEPFTPSKRQYREVDNSITLREQNRTLTAANGNLLRNQMILVQQAEETTRQTLRVQEQRKNDYKEMSQRVEEAMQQAMQAQKQREQDLEAMKLAQQRFEQEMTNRFETDLAKLKVCLFFALKWQYGCLKMCRHKKTMRWQL